MEPRIVLAANVTAIVRGGSLIVTGGDPVMDGSKPGAEVVVRQNGPGSFVVENRNGTLNHSSIGEFIGVTRDLRFVFGSGDDSLTFDQTTSINVSGSVMINGGGGHNTVSSDFHNDDLGSPLIPGSLKIGGSLSIVSTSGQSVDLYNLDIRRDVSLRNENGNTHVAISIRNAEESQSVHQNVIGGNIQILNGRAADLGQNKVLLDSIQVRGNVTIRNQGGNATIEIISTANRNTIDGSLQIANGRGEWSQTNLADLEVKRDLQIDNRALMVVNRIGSVDSQTYVAGNLRISNRSKVPKDNSLSIADTTINNVQIRRVLEVHGDNTERQMISVLSSTITGNTHLKCGQGDDSVCLQNSIFKGDFLLKTGNGNDVLMVGAMGSALHIVFLQETRTRTVIDPVSGEVREETYTVEVPRLEQVDRDAGPVKFSQPARVQFGPGDDLLNLANDAIVTFQTKAVLNGQKGRNAATLGPGNVLGSPNLKHLPNAS